MLVIYTLIYDTKKNLFVPIVSSSPVQRVQQFNDIVVIKINQDPRTASVDWMLHHPQIISWLKSILESVMVSTAD